MKKKKEGEKKYRNVESTGLLKERNLIKILCGGGTSTKGKKFFYFSILFFIA